jgi:opacity protein-like surface antigen
MLSRHHVHALAIAAVLCAMALWPAAANAQEGIETAPGALAPALTFYAHGGGFNPLIHLDKTNDIDFKTGFNVGGGLAYHFSPYAGVRGNFNFARAEARQEFGTFNPVVGTKFNRFLYDADLQLRYPLQGGATPYVFVGGGGITVKQDISTGPPTFTRLAGKVGLGLNYLIPNSDVGIYFEGAGWVYKFDKMGFNRTQFDTTWNGGFSYRFKL